MKYRTVVVGIEEGQARVLYWRSLEEMQATIPLAEFPSGRPSVGDVFEYQAGSRDERKRPKLLKKCEVNREAYLATAKEMVNIARAIYQCAGVIDDSLEAVLVLSVRESSPEFIARTEEIRANKKAAVEAYKAEQRRKKTTQAEQQ